MDLIQRLYDYLTENMEGISDEDLEELETIFFLIFLHNDLKNVRDGENVIIRALRLDVLAYLPPE
ncbi:MAG: hypothetical protein ACOC4M_12150 [Promethearchaeia archaeon]